jgi:hypothetical protein
MSPAADSVPADTELTAIKVRHSGAQVAGAFFVRLYTVSPYWDAAAARPG